MLLVKSVKQDQVISQDGDLISERFSWNVVKYATLGELLQSDPGQWG